jgi:UPF0755 protein
LADLPGQPRRRRWRWLLAALLLLMAGTGAAGLYARHALNAPGPLPQARAVVVPHGTSLQVAEALRDAQVIDTDLPFRLAVFATRNDGALHAAELEFPAHASLRGVLAVLRTGKPIEHRLTIPEGLTAAQITTLLAQADALTGAVVLAEQGSVLPDTYDYAYGTSRAQLLEHAQAALHHTLDRLWATRAPNLPLASPRDALILASIVERETAKPEERPHVAAVFLNRLRQGMKLQADSTVSFAASEGSGTLGHGLTRAELDRDDPYNTYRNLGLPPGPICAPGLASLRAVLQPTDTDDLYFVADGTGGHVFAHTLDQHARNVARWRALNVSR